MNKDKKQNTHTHSHKK